MSAQEREAIEAFKRDVIEPSMTSLVILDFWAEWCGPCKALSPVLEKVATDYADRGVVLAKINVDENPAIAAQFRVQSIPTVYAVFQGQLVADLTPARTESQLTGALDQILKQLPVKGEAQNRAQEIAPLLAMGEEVLAGGDGTRAAGIFSQIRDMAPESAAALAGLVRALLLTGDTEEAAALTAAATPEQAKDPAMAQALSALALAQTAKPAGDLDGLRQRSAADPDNQALAFELAGALMAAGDRDGAADTLLAMIAQDREWNDSAARGMLLKLFEATGLEDPWTAAQRRRLSAILFG